MNTFTRRDFLKLTALGGASFAAALLSGCNVYATITALDPASSAGEGEQDVTDTGGDEIDLPITQERESPFADSVFTLNYNYSEPLNPYTCSNRFNLLVGQLVYESLFTYDADFNPEPMLADTWSTSDGKVWRISLKRGVYFHDGHQLTASDVVYSLRQSANASGTFYGRFSTSFCADITATDTYDLTFTLAYADWDFLRMLDVPILQTGAAGQEQPVGTGPYRLATSTNSSTGQISVFLSLFDTHRNASQMPIDTVYLTEYSDGNLSSAFSDGYIDLLEFDPVGIEAVSVQMDHETRYYNTTVLQYLGYNFKNTLLGEASIRQAIGHVINYDLIVNDIMGGKALASPLILSPALPIYDAGWEAELGAGYDLVAFSSAFAAYGMVDADDDGYLEYPRSGWQDFSFRLLVNNDNSTKIAVAERIAASLRSVGVSVEVETASFSQYLYKLNHGDFDMYIAEVRLPADFNPLELLTKYGVSNYGSVAERTGQEGSYTQLVREYLAASPYAVQGVVSSQPPEGEGDTGDGDGDGDTGSATEPQGQLVEDATQRAAAALELCRYVYNTAPIIPICYKKYCVISHRNVVYNLKPSKSNVFRNFAECTIELD